MPGRDKKRAWCEALWEALQSARTIDTASAGLEELSVDEAYEVQALLIEKKIQEGERVIGWKVGATSQAILEMLRGVTDEPVLGCMTSRSVYPNGSSIPASRFCTPAFEGEIALIMERPLKGPGITSADVVRAAFGVMASVEIVDSRVDVRDGNYRNIIADNSAHAGILLGPTVKAVTELDLRLEGVMISKNGRLVGSGCGCEALGSPIHVVAWLANKLAQFDRGIEAGEIISTGSLGQIAPLEAGDVIDVSYTHLGSVQFSVTQ